MNTPIPILEKAAIQSLTLRSAAVIAAAAADRLGVVLPEGAAQEIANALIDLVVTLA